FFAELSRHFVVALLAFIWMYVVPLPGIIIYDAGFARYSMTLASLLKLILIMVGILAGSGLAFRVINKVTGMITNFKATQLIKDIEEFEPTLEAANDYDHIGKLRALIADIAIYIDQGSYSYADRWIKDARKLLNSLKKTSTKSTTSTTHLAVEPTVILTLVSTVGTSIIAVVLLSLAG